ncbi:ADP-ribose pyrophosphatase YjhB (NUDIX family) [Dyadobacter jejuensis]|uniref:ADP-ribose pyrophosphatase YjhB (NUDIX family) n=1 Tax=Dyadobacter jejuensis TaxID=1082580 RepID=A0A316AGB5_9BACT|nr:NUDIX domain-containing protein [Dyadobacter jejuensis]PWJ56743.1 ADP-ribose pyrophosphatase YjhB (NUDIX family) [Dyadobacter jejuensis]
MILFFDDRPCKIVRPNRISAEETSHFDHIIDLRLSKFSKEMLSGHVLFLNTTGSVAVQIVQSLETTVPVELLSITMATREKSILEDRIKGLYKVVKAAGGVVMKEDKWLFMYRRKKWDLPKGKLDKSEKSKAAAVREIEEETGVKAVIKDKLCTTWHTYTFNGNRILKKTKWYVLDCVDDSTMAPQVEEQIEKLDWLTPKEAKTVLINSFSSIRFVISTLTKIQQKNEQGISYNPE